MPVYDFSMIQKGSTEPAYDFSMLPPPAPKAGHESVAPMPEEQVPGISASDVVKATTDTMLSVPKSAIAVGEAVGSMTSSFGGALSGAVVGLIDAIRNKDPQAFAPAFKAIQEATTYEPRTEGGQAVMGAMGDFFTRYSESVDRYLADPNVEQGNALLATVGKASGEILPVLLGFARVGGPPKIRSKNAHDAPEPALEGELLGPEVPPPTPQLRHESTPTLPTSRQLPAPEGMPPEMPRLPQEPGVPAPITPRPTVEPPAAALVAPNSPGPVTAQVTALATPERSPVARRDVVDGLLPPDEVVTVRAEDTSMPLASPHEPPPGMYDSTPSSKWKPHVAPQGQRGAINMGEIMDGVRIVMKKLEPAGENWRKVRRAIRAGTQPLQAGTPETAAIAKNLANHNRLIKDRASREIMAVRKFTPEDHVNMIRGIEEPSRRAALTPDQLAIVDKMNGEMTYLSDLAMQLGIIGGVRRPYAKHVVESFATRPGNPLRASWLRTGIKTGQRKHATFVEGEAAGVKYRYDWKDMVKAKSDLEQAVYGKLLMKTLKDSVLAGTDVPMLLRQGSPGARDYVSIDHPAFFEQHFSGGKHLRIGGKNYQIKNGEVTVGGKTYPVTKDGSAVYVAGKAHQVLKETRVSSTRLVVHPDLATPLKAVLGTQDPWIVAQGLRALKAASMKFIMFNPLFHGATVFFKQLPLSISKSHINPIGLYMEGYRLRTDPVWRDKAFSHNVNILENMGYKMDAYGEQPLAGESFYHFVHPKFGKIMDKVGNFWHGTLLWNRIGDMQMGVFKRYGEQFETNMLKEYEAKHGVKPDEATAKHISDAAYYQSGELANLVAGAWGKEDFFLAWKNTLDTVLFSTSYTMSTMRIAKYAAGSIPRHLQGQVTRSLREFPKGEIPKEFAKIAKTMVLIDLMLWMATAQGLNYAFTSWGNIPDKHGKIGGHFAWDNEYGKTGKIAIGMKEDGTVLYMGNFFRTARDIAEIITAPQTLAQNKQSPIFKAIMSLVENRDWKGNTIFKEGADAWYDDALAGATHLANAVTGYESTKRSLFPDEDEAFRRLNLLGLQTSVGAPGGMQTGELKHIARVQAEADAEVLLEAASLASNGEESEAIDLLITNNFTAGQIKAFLLKENFPALQHLGGLDYKRLYQKATPKQKESLDRMGWGTSPRSADK